VTPDEALRAEIAVRLRVIRGMSEADRRDGGWNYGAAMSQAGNYPGKLGNDWICPRCWLAGKRSPMRALPGGDDYDRLACNDDHCALVVEVPFS
jgi:hypothetical protein